MSTAASITSGFLLTVLAGLLNGSWNASFSSKLGIAIPSTTRVSKVENVFTKINEMYQHIPCTNKNEYDLDFEYAWVIFQIYACIINSIICILQLGAYNIGTILSQATPISLILVILFSFLWGIGSVLFGVACRIAGVGLGTNLTMGVIVIVGTFLPLITNGIIKTWTGLVIIIGIAICCVGLYYSMKSLKLRDGDENNVLQGATELTDDIESRHGDNDVNSIEFEHVKASGFVTSRPIPETNETIKTANPATHSIEMTTPPVPIYTTTQKVLTCIVAGVFSSLLQFAFIFGEPIVDIAKKTLPNNGSNASIIWLLAFLFGIPPSLIYGIHSSKQKHKNTETKVVPFYKAIYLCPIYRHILIILTTSLPWIAHVHLYGIAVTIYLPAKISTSIAWPVLMMITVMTGMLLSIYLGEWEYASRKAIVVLGVGFRV